MDFILLQSMEFCGATQSVDLNISLGNSSPAKPEIRSVTCIIFESDGRWQFKEFRFNFGQIELILERRILIGKTINSVPLVCTNYTRVEIFPLRGHLPESAEQPLIHRNPLHPD